MAHHLVELDLSFLADTCNIFLVRDSDGQYPKLLDFGVSRSQGSARVTDPDPESKYQALEKYGRDLTAEARRGKMDPVIGRDDEIRRVVQILSRRTKNNPALIGDPGVGKTAIVEGLAQRMSCWSSGRLLIRSIV